MSSLLHLAYCPPVSHILLKIELSSFFSLNNIPLYVCMYYTFSNHSSIDGPLGCHHILATMDIAVNVGLQFSLQDPDCNSLRYIPWGGITTSYGGSVIRFLWNLYIVFHRGCTNLHSQQQYTSILLSQHPYQ